MQLTKNFTLEEFCASDTAGQLKINNSPPPAVVVNITRLAQNVMQRIRDHFKAPVIITSGYRCPTLNKAIGGAPDSQHTKGEAVDFKVIGYSIEEVFQWCRANLEFDQIIQEKGQWVHISFRAFGNRREVLRFDGKRYTKA